MDYLSYSHLLTNFTPKEGNQEQPKHGITRGQPTQMSLWYVRVKAWTYLFCSGGLGLEEEEKVRRGRKDVEGGS